MILGGKDSNGNLLDSILEYTFKTNKISKSSFILNEPKCNFGAVVRDNKLYLIGGCNEQSLSTFEEYKIGSTGFIWKKLPNMTHSRN